MNIEPKKLGRKAVDDKITKILIYLRSSVAQVWTRERIESLVHIHHNLGPSAPKQDDDSVSHKGDIKVSQNTFMEHETTIARLIKEKTALENELDKYKLLPDLDQAYGKSEAATMVDEAYLKADNKTMFMSKLNTLCRTRL